MSIGRALERRVHRLIGFGTGEIDLDRPPGDEGLFGPGSMAWKVHGDFTTMMVGGIGALLLQMLHPGALAGIWDHSNFRQDMLGRLRRTAQFISGTTYGATGEATRLIERVRTVHDRVQGTMPDGAGYSANDPVLLTWVHVAEVSSFLRAYVRYRAPFMPLADQDRYYAEVATIAERLGAAAVPRTRDDVDRYLQRMRPQLRCDARTREVARALLSQPVPSLAMAAFRVPIMEAGIDLLPDWAARMHGLRLSLPRMVLARVGTQGLHAVLHKALSGGSARRARQRVSGRMAPPS